MFKEAIIAITAVAIAISLVVGGFIGILFIWSQARLVINENYGEGNLRKAAWEKQIIIEQANAENESATLKAEATIKQETANAEAERIRARGVADANQIIAEGLKNNEEYLRYLWINKISTEAQVIYVPTETGLPILEAGKRN